MPWLKKKIDPISDRAAALSAEIATLESQIKKLSTQLEDKQSHPRLRSTAMPHGPTVSRAPMPAAHPSAVAAHEPIFEEVDRDRLNSRGEVATPEHFNELGVRKYDLPALLQRFRNHFRGPATTNPRLVNYLAAGGVQGLRPLRYEKRVARNRFILLVAFLFFMLLGIILVFWPHH